MCVVEEVNKCSSEYLFSFFLGACPLQEEWISRSSLELGKALWWGSHLRNVSTSDVCHFQGQALGVEWASSLPSCPFLPVGVWLWRQLWPGGWRPCPRMAEQHNQRNVGPQLFMGSNTGLPTWDDHLPPVTHEGNKVPYSWSHHISQGSVREEADVQEDTCVVRDLSQDLILSNRGSWLSCFCKANFVTDARYPNPRSGQVGRQGECKAG